MYQDIIQNKQGKFEETVDHFHQEIAKYRTNRATPALIEHVAVECYGVKALNQTAEEARIAVRNVREEILKEIQTAEKEGLMSEDDKFRGKEAVQEIVEEFNKKIEDIRKKKEEEIMTV